jgi:hypothetical protein
LMHRVASKLIVLLLHVLLVVVLSRAISVSPS